MRKVHKVYDFRCHASASEPYRLVAFRSMYENQYSKRHSKSKKTCLRSTKRANIFLFIIEVTSEGTTILEPVMDQMPLIRETLNKTKEKKLAVGGISVFFLCRRTITTKKRARPLSFTPQLLCLSRKGSKTVSISVLVPCSGQYFISFSTSRWYRPHQPVAIWRCVCSCNESQNLLHQIFYENKQINEQFESYSIQ